MADGGLMGRRRSQIFDIICDGVGAWCINNLGEISVVAYVWMRDLLLGKTNTLGKTKQNQAW
eukprot:scaffold224207_cov30-Attheya_sp.AAC.1